MFHQLFAARLQARDIYPELKKYICRKHSLSDVTWEEFLTTEFALWIDTCSSTDNNLHGSGRAVEKVVYCFRSKKHLKQVVLTLHATYLFSLEDAVAHLIVTDPSSILAIVK